MFKLGAVYRCWNTWFEAGDNVYRLKLILISILMSIYGDEATIYVSPRIEASDTPNQVLSPGLMARDQRAESPHMATIPHPPALGIIQEKCPKQ